MKFNIMKAISNKAGRFGLKLRAHSPEILLVAGIGGMVVGTVLACKETTKLPEILDESKKEIEQIHAEEEATDEKETNKKIAKAWAKTSFNIAKLYLPAATIGCTSVACVLGAHHIIKKRNIALSVANTTLLNGFNDYRERVIDRFGKELDDELRYGVTAVEEQETIVDENGKKKTVKKMVKVVDPKEISKYAEFYMDGDNGWDEDPELSLAYLRAYEGALNTQLQTRGHMLWNDVLDGLKKPRTMIGATHGWVWDKDNPVYIDLGINSFLNKNVIDPEDKRHRENVIILDPNIQGDILSKMSSHTWF